MQWQECYVRYEDYISYGDGYTRYHYQMNYVRLQLIRLLEDTY